MSWLRWHAALPNTLRSSATREISRTSRRKRYSCLRYITTEALKVGYSLCSPELTRPLTTFRRLPHNPDPLRRRLLHALHRYLLRNDLVELLLQGLLHQLVAVHHRYHAMGVSQDEGTRDLMEDRCYHTCRVASDITFRHAYLREVLELLPVAVGFLGDPRGCMRASAAGAPSADVGAHRHQLVLPHYSWAVSIALRP